MQSKIRIEYDFDSKQPVLRITQSEDSDDLRDQMLKSFLQKAGWVNSRLYITYPEYSGRTTNNIIEIRCEENVPDATLPDTGNDLPSRFQIGEDVDYTTKRWMDDAFHEARQRTNSNIPDADITYIPNYSQGKVNAVRFTRGKVYYEIIDDYTGDTTQNIPSDQVKRFSDEVRQSLNAEEGPLLKKQEVPIIFNNQIENSK